MKPEQKLTDFIFVHFTHMYTFLSVSLLCILQYSEKIFDTSRGGLYDYTVTDLTPATVYRFVISADNGFWEPVLSYNSVEFETLGKLTFYYIGYL